MPHYIVINGAPHSGRTTLAKIISRELGESAIREEFNRPLKHFFSAGLGMPWEQIDTPIAKAILNGQRGVDALRQLRTHIRAVFGPDALARWLEHRVLGMRPLPRFVIIDDGLFAEDVGKLRTTHGGVTLVRIKRHNVANFTPIMNPDHEYENVDDYMQLESWGQTFAATIVKKGHANV